MVIIAFNEERNLPHCLDSLEGIADEVLVVDSGSTDRTVALAEERGARVLTHAFEGHIEQKNWAAAQATGEWLLSLDADEASALNWQRPFAWRADAATSINGFRMNRLTSYWVSGCARRLVPGHGFGFGRRDMPWTGENPHDHWTWRRR